MSNSLSVLSCRQANQRREATLALSPQNSPEPPSENREDSQSMHCRECRTLPAKSFPSAYASTTQPSSLRRALAHPVQLRFELLRVCYREVRSQYHRL